jgi:hypothetical protein
LLKKNEASAVADASLRFTTRSSKNIKFHDLYVNIINLTYQYNYWRSYYIDTAISIAWESCLVVQMRNDDVNLYL